MAGKASTPWTPSDDLLLKNSIEAGASFEALAKGAARFSRAFMVHELRERWHVLLYDPDVSVQASARMMELELAGFDSSSMFGRLDNARNAGVTGKRKNLSIRRQYNVMRKRLKTELFDSNEVGLLGPSVHDTGSGGTNCMLRDCISDHFGLQDSTFDVLHRVFPQQAGDIGSASGVDHPVNVYETQCQNLTDYNYSVTNVRDDNIYGFPENITPMVVDDAKGSLESNFDDKVALNSMLHTSTQDPLQELPDDNHFEADTDGSALLHAMGFSSQMPRLPLWKTMEDMSVPAMPVHLNEGDTTNVVEEASQLPDNYQKRGKTPSGFDVNSEPLMKGRQNGKFYNLEAVCNTVSQGEFPELSDSLLNFPNEDELPFMNVDGKDTMDSTSCENINSLVISSASAAQESGLCNIEPYTLCNIEPCTTLVSNTFPEISCSPRGTELKNSVSSFLGDVQHSTLHSEINVASTTMLHFDSSQLNEENVCCVLNTEETEIPCNDDIFLLIHSTSFSPVRKPPTMASIDPSSSADEEDNERGVYLMEKVNDPALSYEFSPACGSNKLPESYTGLPLAGCKVKSEVPDPKCFSLHPIDVSKTTRDSSQSRSFVATSVTIPGGVVEEEVKVEPLVSDNPSASMEMALPAIVDNPSASDQDEPESENDVPYFSDIETMILEMDLAPHDQDSYTSRHGLKYEDEDARKKIIRLEQCARSSLQRKMTSHGALAFLYGRHLKHYMKKTEVLLGRSTDDVDVDIDLRKEGRARASTISRRQASIKIKTDGSFVIKNLGKSSISVNGQAIACEHSLCLISSSLIEIKGMSFVFEINHKYVRRYLDTINKNIA